MSTYAEAVLNATAQVRTYNVWILREPSGNYYTCDTSRGRQVPPGDIAVAVVRKGTTALEILTPKAWKRAS